MDAQALAQKVALEIRDASNDIDAYLASDVPIECYRKDIDTKLVQMKVNIVTMILKESGLSRL
jgi:hypothetical protein